MHHNIKSPKYYYVTVSLVFDEENKYVLLLYGAWGSVVVKPLRY